jgi:nucleotide-binding universal stress UspA family protein
MRGRAVIYNQRDRRLGRNIAAWEKHDLVVKDLEHNSKELLEKYKSKALLQAFTTTEIISAACNSGEEILRAGREKMDTIVMGSRGLSTSSELLLGSKSYNVPLAE